MTNFHFYMQLQQFRQQIYHRGVKFTAYGFFHVDTTMLFTVNKSYFISIHITKTILFSFSDDWCHYYIPNHFNSAPFLSATLMSSGIIDKLNFGASVCSHQR